MSVKNVVFIFSTMVIVSALFFYGCRSSANKRSPDIVIEDVNLANVSDGTYEGEHTEGPVWAKVLVTVKDHRISDIEIVNHRTLMGKKAEAITDDVIMEQSIRVDTVTGATWSSKVILKAIEKALQSVES